MLKIPEIFNQCKQIKRGIKILTLVNNFIILLLHGTQEQTMNSLVLISCSNWLDVYKFFTKILKL